MLEQHRHSVVKDIAAAAAAAAAVLRQVLAGTWNVNETRPSRSGLQTWLGDRASSAHIIMIGLQVMLAVVGSLERWLRLFCTGCGAQQQCTLYSA
jgi:hypothetical protein